MKSLKEELKKIDFGKGLKTAGVLIVGALIVAVVLSVGQTFLGGRMGGYSTNSIGLGAPTMPAYDSLQYSEEGAKGYGGEGMMSPDLSVRNIFPVPTPGPVTGNTAEEFEVTDYAADIETRNLDETCGAVTDLKSLTYVIFENSSKYDRGCSYSFKVEKERVLEILAALRALDPKNLSENTRTIKRQIDDFASHEEILKNKLTSIDETLKLATGAYDQITRLATQSQDVATLAKIIDSKIQVIERLTSERINVSTQLDQLSRVKAAELDRLDYTYFSVSITENTYIDAKSIKDSWKMAVRQFVQNLNVLLQGSTISLLLFLVFIIQAALYLFLVLFAAKYGWKWIKKIWQK